MLYDVSKSYLENLREGPCFKGTIPQRKDPASPLHFLGHQLNSPLGVAAGPLLNSRWVALASKLGFDVLVYKTIRSKAHPSLPQPNVIFVDATGPNTAIEKADAPFDASDVAITNSFGMPSLSPDFLLHDIQEANRSIQKGQLLIVSVVGTKRPSESFIGDFVRTAELAKEGGAKVIEANFSCPNVDRSEGMLYASPEAVQQFSAAIARAIHPLPLILKVGNMPRELLRSVLIAAARGGAKGVCGINAIPMKVLNQQQKPALGAARESSGVCGAPIRERALLFLKVASSIIQDEKLDLVLMGCGGVTAPEHFDDILQSGALIAMCATGMMWNPLIGMRYHNAAKTSHLAAL